MLDQSAADASMNSPTEQQSDVDFLCPLQRVTSLSDVIYADGDGSWLRLVHGAILNKPTPTSSGRRLHRHLGPYSPSSPRSDENASSRPAKRSLFGRRDSPAATSTPLRDIGNAGAPTHRALCSYGRCASDTAAVNCRRPRPTPLIKSHSVLTAVLTTVADNDDQRLVGDFTRPLCLPVVSDSKHCDLNAISHHTVRHVNRFIIIEVFTGATQCYRGICYGLCLVCLSVCLIQAGIVRKRMNGSSSFWPRGYSANYPTLCWKGIRIYPKNKYVAPPYCRLKCTLVASHDAPW